MPDIGAFFTATIAQHITPKIADAIVEPSEFLSYMKEKKRFNFGNGGDNYTFRVRKEDSAIGGATTDWGSRTFSTTNPYVTLTPTYRNYSWNLFLNGWQKRRNENAPDASRMFKLLEESVKEVKQSAQTRVAYHAYNGNADLRANDDGTPIDGLIDIVDDDNTYLGVDRSLSTGAYLRAQTDSVAKFSADTDNIGVCDGIRAMKRLLLACQRGMQSGNGVDDNIAVPKANPDGVFTTSTIFTAYENGLAPQFRYMEKTADAKKTVLFDGLSMKWDNYCPTGKLFITNSQTLEFMVVGNELVEILFEGDQANPLGHVWMIGGNFQMHSDNPRYNGRLDVTAI